MLPFEDWKPPSPIEQFSINPQLFVTEELTDSFLTVVFDTKLMTVCVVA